jgi:hypothetical protein
MTNLNEVIKTSPVIVHKGKYAYLKTKDTKLNNHFLVSKDKDEITIITEEKNIKKTKYEKIVKWFKLFEIQVSAPFLCTGFLAFVGKTISDKNLNILFISTFSKDYFLIREKDFNIAVKAMKEAGFSVKIE